MYVENTTNAGLRTLSCGPSDCAYSVTANEELLSRAFSLSCMYICGNLLRGVKLYVVVHGEQGDILYVHTYTYAQLHCNV